MLELPRDATVLLSCHVNPDGDALGTMLGFALGLRSLGFSNIRASFPEPYAVAEPFQFLPGLDLLVPPDLAPRQPDLAVSFDAASPGRLGVLSDCSAAAATWIVLDHHISNTGFGSVQLVDPAAAATAVVAVRLLDELGVELDEAMATCLYVALATDSGSFRFDTTTAGVLALAARLVDAGARPGEIALHVFDSRSYAAVRLWRRYSTGPSWSRRRRAVVAWSVPTPPVPTWTGTASRPRCWRASWMYCDRPARPTSPAWSSR